MTMQMNYQFNPMQYEPAGDFEAIPAGKYPCAVTRCEVKALKDNKPGALFKVELTVLEGAFRGRKVFNNFNLWNPNPQAVDIAHRQLSGLCRAAGVGMLDFNNGGQALVNARCLVNVGVKDDNNEVKGYAALSAGPAPMPPSAPAPQAHAPMNPVAAVQAWGQAPQAVAPTYQPAPAPAPVPQQWQQPVAPVPTAPPPQPQYQMPQQPMMPPAPAVMPSTAGQAAPPWAT